MISYVTGDATQPHGSGLKIITHCCNDIGAWGSGFVVALSRRWPHVEAAYRELDTYTLGHVQYVRAEEEIVVANIIGQHKVGIGADGRPPVRYDAIYDGLRDVANVAIEGNASVHMPRMGAGLAGGSWEIMEAIIKDTLVYPGIDVTVYDLPR